MTGAVKKKVLFICVHNSARSQMAEAWFNHLCGDEFEAESAGLEPGVLNPLVVRAMGEVGIDISRKTTRSVAEALKTNKLFAYVITVCDAANAACPVFPGHAERLHWSLADPAAVKGSYENRLAAFRSTRDQIHERIRAFIG